MPDLDQWNVRGPVQTLRIEFAEWDVGNEEWQASRSSTLVRFLTNGRISEMESRNADRSVARSAWLYDEAGRVIETRFSHGTGKSSTTYRYDDSGRLSSVGGLDQDGVERNSERYEYGPDGQKTKVYFVPKFEGGFAYSIEGLDMGYGATYAASIWTSYDRTGQPIEVQFQDSQERVLRRVILSRDAEGRVLRVEMHPEMRPELEALPPEVRESAAAMLGPSIVTTFAYDGGGRPAERGTRIGDLGENRTVFRYDDYHNKSEETTEDTSREIQIDDEGHFQTVSERSSKQHSRFEYRYDSRGNWTERIVWGRLEPNPDFQRSNIERREILYFADGPPIEGR